MTGGFPSVQRDGNTGHPLSMEAPQLAGKGWLQDYLLMQYTVGLQGRHSSFTNTASGENPVLVEMPSTYQPAGSTM